MSWKHPIEKQLTVGLEPGPKDESRQGYLARVVRYADTMAKTKWDKLDRRTQDWLNAASRAFKRGENIPDFPGMPQVQQYLEDALNDVVFSSGWKPNQLVEAVQGQIPPAILVALSANRAELIPTVDVPALSAPEAQAVFRVVRALLETNQALQRHAHEVARLVAHWQDLMLGMERTARRIEHFANFRQPTEEEEDS